jgi:hypothetical protein
MLLKLVRKMENVQEIPGEDEGLQHYFGLPQRNRKLIVDMCSELYQMTYEEQVMLLGIARAYRKKKPVVEPMPVRSPQRASHLRLVA